MSLIVPTFKNTRCASVTACGEVQRPDQELLQWMKKQKPMIAPIGSGSDKAVIRVSFGGHSGNHLHIDVTKLNLYRQGFEPKITTEIAAIQKALDRFDGMEAEADLTGMFEISLEELPEGGIIRSLFFQTRTGDVAIKVDGALLSITGAPVNVISWRALKDKQIGVTIEAENVKTKVTDDYLTSGLNILGSALNVFVLGRTTNEPKK